MKKLIATVAGVEVWWDGTWLQWLSGFAVDADGSPHCYHSKESKLGLDSWKSACYPDQPENYRNILVCDAKGVPIVQDGKSPAQPAKDFFIAQTTYQRAEFAEADVRRYLNAETEPYVVAPLSLVDLLPGVFIGCTAEVQNTETGRSYGAVCGDLGPRNRIGEGSLKLAHDLGWTWATPRNGQDKKICRFSIRPGDPALVAGIKYQLQPRHHKS